MPDTCCAASCVREADSKWSARDRRGRVLCRLSNRFRMRYTVAPGLYRLGAAGRDSPVLVTASYKLSFDHLRTSMAGRDAWILVLDTKGINVWCAAGKGTFGTAELIARIREAGLEGLVDRRRVILPQLGAPGVSAHVVEAETGFAVSYGPVRAADLPEALNAGGRVPASVRTVRFGLSDRLALIPMELGPALPKLLLFVLGVLVVQGLAPEGILFGRALATGWPLALLGALGVVSGSFLTPLLLPVVPGRAFAVKGALVGLAVAAAALRAMPGLRTSGLAVATALILVPAVASALALAFTGATTFTNISGVRRELRVAVPLYAAAALAVAALVIADKVRTWGVSL